MNAILAGLLAIFAMIAAAPLFASDGPASVLTGTETGSKVIHAPALQVARVLMNAERWQEARLLLERLNLRTEEERIERLFLLGLAEARLGLLPEAAERFEAILAIRPGLTRVRLELARAYHLLGRDEKARFHFEASLGDELPSSVEVSVRVPGDEEWVIRSSAFSHQPRRV